MFRKVRRIGSEAVKVRVSIKIKKISLGDVTFAGIKNISVVFERGGKQVSSSEQDVVVGSDGRCELEYQEDLVMTVTLYRQADDVSGGNIVFHDKTGRLIVRQNKGRGGVMGKEVFQELGVVSLLLHQICALQCSDAAQSTAAYTLPITKIKSPGSVMEIEMTIIRMQSLQIDDDNMSEVSGYSDVSSVQSSAKGGAGVFARISQMVGTSSAGAAVPARTAQPPSAAAGGGGGPARASVATKETDALRSKLDILQMNLDRALIDRDNIAALHGETEREVAALRQQAKAAEVARIASLAPPASSEPGEHGAALPPASSVETESLRIESRRLAGLLSEKEVERDSLASQVAAALMQAQRYQTAAEQDRADRDVAKRDCESALQQLEQVRRSMSGSSSSSSSNSPASRADLAKMEQTIELLQADRAEQADEIEALRKQNEELSKKVCLSMFISSMPVNFRIYRNDKS